MATDQQPSMAEANTGNAPVNGQGSQLPLPRSNSISQMSEDSQTAQEYVAAILPRLHMLTWLALYEVRNNSNWMRAKHCHT